MGILCCKEKPIDFSAPVELSHFTLQRSVGRGSFGKVRIVQHRGTKKVFALKYINKVKCICMKAVENIIQERRILEEASSTFICNLRYAFQDDENLFMVLDLMLGGDLRFHLDRMTTLPLDAIKFIAAEISLALVFLHNRRIIHRDVKPDNILLDERGHAHLTDFNIAVRLRKDKPLTAVAGSMAYMAPEILAKKGYYTSVDYWSLGVVVYEMVYGKRPFKSRTNDGLIAAIKKGEFSFPEDKTADETCKSFISSLLTKDITARIGCKEAGGHESFRSHPFVKSLDWEKIAKKEAIPPFQPDPNKANFDATHELEELFLEDNPLRVKKRKRVDAENGTIKPKFGEDPVVTKQLQIMEKKFTIYDYTKALPRSDAEMPEPPNTNIASIKFEISKHVPCTSLEQLTVPPQDLPVRKGEEESFHRDVMEGKSVLDLMEDAGNTDKDSEEGSK